MKEPWVNVIDAAASLFFKQMPPETAFDRRG
jgi:hypothetical protein